ncbi:MAG: hypothetical protein IM586_13495 [Pseudanabaena sp. M172S2SP2A07QC]|jgi:hypothetical protein|nr:hypothetical protein [Pseudanabaena sp. M172S2SP2A07QC]MCA6510297.1 hypothetical protein [Pseudanabaena sp. M109S1SP2A07QC]MCA6546653.1 hypothetical protein [Pseudanabaena sp. M152S2SP2A07QC]
MISNKVSEFAQKNGFQFFVNGLGYRKLAEITDLEGNHIGWTSNKSASALIAINALIKQREIDAKSDEAIATEAAEAISDLLPPVVVVEAAVAEQAYQELLPVVGSWEQRHAERFATAQGDDFASTTYMTRDTFGDDAFVFSARYGCGALI